MMTAVNTQAWRLPVARGGAGLDDTHGQIHTCLVCRVQGTLTEFKNELLFSRFGINYSKISEQFKKVGQVRAAQRRSDPHGLLPTCLHAASVTLHGVL